MPLRLSGTRFRTVHLKGHRLTPRFAVDRGHRSTRSGTPYRAGEALVIQSTRKQHLRSSTRKITIKHLLVHLLVHLFFLPPRTRRHIFADVTRLFAAIFSFEDLVNRFDGKDAKHLASLPHLGHQLCQIDCKRQLHQQRLPG